MSARFSFGVLAILPCVTACDPVGHIEGVVVGTTSTPITSATVHLHCASSGVDRTTTTDSAGHFTHEGIAIGPPFTLEISKPGFTTHTVSAPDVCFAKGPGAHCASVPNVVLTQAP